jgi:hypothetical protein
MIQKTLGEGGAPPYIALHARLEPEMLLHNICIDRKVYNLTTILDMIQSMEHNTTDIRDNGSLYIAIGLKEMEEGNPYDRFNLEHRLNMEALRGVKSNGLELPGIRH